MVAYSAVSYEAKGATKPALGSVKIEADTKVSVSERLVSFKDFRITESNFPTLPKEQTREVVAEIDEVDPGRRARHRARPRAGQRGPQPDHPEGDAGREGRSAHDLLQPDARRAREPRRRADLEPDQGERPQVRRQHELGPLPARADEDLLPAQGRHLPEGGGPRRGRGRRRASCPRASPSSRRRQLEGREGGASRQEDRRQAGAARLREHDAGGDDPPRRQAALPAARGDVALLGQQHATATCSGSVRRAPSTTSWPDAGSARPASTGPWTFATPTLPADFQKIPLEHPRSRVLASVPGTAAGGGGRAARADPPDRAREQEDSRRRPRSSTRASRSSRRSRRPRSSAPSTPTRASSRSATCTTCATRACGSWAAARTAPGRWRARCRARSTRSRSARPPTTSPT